MFQPGLEPRASGIPCQCSNHWAIEPAILTDSHTPGYPGTGTIFNFIYELFFGWQIADPCWGVKSAGYQLCCNQFC